jgi:hypothetical protein
MLNRRTLALSSLVCATAALALSIGPASASAKTTVIGQVTHHTGTPTTSAFLDPAILTSKTVKYPKRNSITVNVTAVPDDPATPNSIYVSGLVSCKKKPKDAIGKYVIGGEYKAVPSPFTVKTPFPYGVSKPAACRVSVSSNLDVPLEIPSTQPYPSATITIKVLWTH